MKMACVGFDTRHFIWLRKEPAALPPCLYLDIVNHHTPVGGRVKHRNGETSHTILQTLISFDHCRIAHSPTRSDTLHGDAFRHHNMAVATGLTHQWTYIVEHLVGHVAHLKGDFAEFTRRDDIVVTIAIHKADITDGNTVFLSMDSLYLRRAVVLILVGIIIASGFEVYTIIATIVGIIIGTFVRLAVIAVVLLYAAKNIRFTDIW